jgi:hypothetical protein
MNKLPERLHSLTDRQKQCLIDEHRFIVNSAGRRSRKTLIFSRKLLTHALENPGNKYFQGAPTRSQAKSIFWQRLKDNTYGIRKGWPVETELKITLLNRSEIHVIGLDKPERIEGQPWHGCHITEFGNLKPGAWGEHIRPTLSDTGGFAYLDGVPEGMNHYYDMALFASGGSIPITQEIVGAYGENPDNAEWCFYNWFSSDVLPPAEIEAARMELDERTFRQEYQGAFESYEGLAYWAFGKENMAEVEYNKPDPMRNFQGEHVHIGMDFNVDPMTATFNHVRSNDIFQFGEAYLGNSNTYQMVEHINERFPIGNITIYPDSTGRARESNATESDIAILKKAGYVVRAHSINPRQKDRVNAFNSKLKAGDGKPHYFINPKTCPKTINDLNKVESLPDGRINKEQEKAGLTHISSAAGYLIAYLFPVRQRGVESVQR